MIAVRPAEVREVVTPEGVPLRFVLAAAGDRLGAFMVDGAMIVGGTVAILVAAIFFTVAARGIGLAVALLAFFLLRNFYFTWFECRWQGATPGKRLLGLRVIDAHGGMLTAEAVFARNLMREIEVFLPLAAVLAPAQLFPEAPAWARLASTAWLLVFATIPLFNRDRLRLGDIVAGTLVVLSPKVVLLGDLTASPRSAGAGPAGALAFAPEQLDLYGIRELQVLETLLRQRPANPETLAAVARRIQDKIGWRRSGAGVGHEEFLAAFYAAQRARLEQRMLLGERRETKKDGRLTRRP